MYISFICKDGEDFYQNELCNLLKSGLAKKNIAVMEVDYNQSATMITGLMEHVLRNEGYKGEINLKEKEKAIAHILRKELKELLPERIRIIENSVFFQKQPIQVVLIKNNDISNIGENDHYIRIDSFPRVGVVLGNSFELVIKGTFGMPYKELSTGTVEEVSAKIVEEITNKFRGV